MYRSLADGPLATKSVDRLIPTDDQYWTVMTYSNVPRRGGVHLGAEATTLIWMDRRSYNGTAAGMSAVQDG